MKKLIFLFACIAFLGCKKEDCYVFNITTTTVRNDVVISENAQKQILCDITRKDAKKRANDLNYTYKTVSGNLVTEIRYTCTFEKE